MGAECYWCSTVEDLGNPPLGVCSDCWVLACIEHAELETVNLGKWKCFDGVAKLLSAAAGVDETAEVGDRPIGSPQELAERFPRIAAATEAERERWSSDTAALREAVTRVAPDRADDMQEWQLALLGHAVGIARHFVRDITRLREGPRLTGRLGRVVEQL